MTLIIKILVFAALWAVRLFLFDPSMGGPLTGMIFIGETILRTNLTQDGTSVIMTIFSFLITCVVYYIIAEIVTLLITLPFKKKKTAEKK